MSPLGLGSLLGGLLSEFCRRLAAQFQGGRANGEETLCSLGVDYLFTFANVVLDRKRRTKQRGSLVR